MSDGEIYLRLLRCILALIGVGWFCFRVLFPMLGRWIVDLNCKLQNRIAKLKADEDKWKQNVRTQFEEDVVMQSEEPPIEEYFETESQIAKVLSKKKEQQDLNNDNGVVGAPWLIQPK